MKWRKTSDDFKCYIELLGTRMIQIDEQEPTC